MASYNKHSERLTSAFKVRDPYKLLKTVLLLIVFVALSVLIDRAIVLADRQSQIN
jgi:hypothetical protein